MFWVKMDITGQPIYCQGGGGGVIHYYLKCVFNNLEFEKICVLSTILIFNSEIQVFLFKNCLIALFAVHKYPNWKKKDIKWKTMDPPEV